MRREAASSESDPVPSGRLYTVFTGWEHGVRENRMAVASTNPIGHKVLNKGVTIGDWAISRSPGFRVLWQLLYPGPLLDSDLKSTVIKKQRSGQVAWAQSINQDGQHTDDRVCLP